MINNHWHKSSLRSVCNSVKIDRELIGRIDLEEERHKKEVTTTRLWLFSHGLENSTNNFGQYVKEFSCDFMHEYADLIDAVIKFCPKVQVLKISLDQKLSGYIVNAYIKKKGEGVVLWKGLQELGQTSYYGNGAFVYSCFHTFCDTLTTLYIWIHMFNKYLGNGKWSQQQYMIEEDDWQKRMIGRIG